MTVTTALLLCAWILTWELLEIVIDCTDRASVRCRLAI